MHHDERDIELNQINDIDMIIVIELNRETSVGSHPYNAIVHRTSEGNWNNWKQIFFILMFFA